MKSNMKNIVKAFAVLAGVAALSACNKYAEYNWTPFVSLDVRSATISESDPATAWTLPVHIYNHDGACTVTYTVEAISAKEGVDYTLADASGVLSFPAGTDTQNIVVNISGQPGVYTGNVKFAVKLQSASDDVTLGVTNTCTVTVVDKDIKVDWAYIVGVWKAQDYDAEQPDGGQYKVEFKKVDEQTVSLTNLWGGGETIEGTIEFAASGSSATIAFDPLQTVIDASADGFGDLVLIGQNASGKWAIAPAIATISSDGFFLGPWNLLITAGEYEGYIYGTSYMTEFTK